MKTLCAIIALVSLAASLPAQHPTNAPPSILEDKDVWSRFSVSPFGSVSHVDFSGGPIWGAGVDIGFKFNKYVSLHAAALAYEADDWGGPAIDETSVLFRGDLLRFAEGKLIFYGLGSADRSWNEHKTGDGDWGLGLGAGAELAIWDNFSLGADYRIRLWDEHENDSQIRGFISLRF